MSFFFSSPSFLFSLILFDSCLGACWKRSSRTNAASFFGAEAQKVMNIFIGDDCRGNLSEKNRNKKETSPFSTCLYYILSRQSSIRSFWRFSLIYFFLFSSSSWLSRVLHWYIVLRSLALLHLSFFFFFISWYTAYRLFIFVKWFSSVLESDAAVNLCHLIIMKQSLFSLIFCTGLESLTS